MRAFNELNPGDLFLVDGKTWRKVFPVPHPQLRYAPPYNAMKVVEKPPVEGITVAPTYATVVGWLVMVEPSDLEELAQATGTGPCRTGHTFIWTNTTTSADHEPPDGTPCRCGQVRYSRSAGTVLP